jgi:hypothetical protein
MTARPTAGFISLLLVLGLAPMAHAQDLLSRIHPYISVKGEYNDNLNLTATNKKEDFITTVRPGIRFSNMDKTGGLNLDYSLGAVFYSDHDDLDYISHSATLDARYLSAGHVNLYFRDSFIRSDEPREQEYFTMTTDNRYVLATSTERSVYWRNVAAPTLEYQFGPEDRVGVNYRNNIYETKSAAGQDSQEDYINPFFTYWFDKWNGIQLEYGLTLGDFEKQPDLEGHRAYGRYTHRFTPKTSVFVEYTYLKRTYDSAPDSDYDVHEPRLGMAFAFSPTLNLSLQGGYYRQEPRIGSARDGFSFSGDLTNTDQRTTFNLRAESGYKEDLFTSENLGFNRYSRVTGSVNHMLERRFSIGCSGNLERAEFDNPDHTDVIWGVSGRAAYTPLKWLTLSLEVSHRERNSDIDRYDYEENRGMLSLTATY